jgi:hypothetical protein
MIKPAGTGIQIFFLHTSQFIHTVKHITYCIHRVGYSFPADASSGDARSRIKTTVYFFILTSPSRVISG